MARPFDAYADYFIDSSGQFVETVIHGLALHFDHIIPYSKGGFSKDPANIQVLCGRHNLAKHDKIE